MLNHKAIIEPIKIIEFFMIALQSGICGIQPRRNTDYSLMKICNYDKTRDNYYEKGIFGFNVSKTFKTYGHVEISVAKTAPFLNTLIKKWIAINKGDYLLFSPATHKPLTSVQMTQYNSRIWGGKHISVDI
jgi:hypothetical protein